MPTTITHAVIGIGLAGALPGKTPGRPLYAAAAAVSFVPDLDTYLMEWIPYHHPLGHRGFSHSLLFGLVLAVAAALILRFAEKGARRKFIPLLLFLFALTVLHGIFDAMTDGGLGVGFFIPFENSRYFLPIRPIPVSWIGLSNMFHERTVVAFVTELGLFWAPAAIPFAIRYLKKPAVVPAVAALSIVTVAVWTIRIAVSI